MPRFKPHNSLPSIRRGLLRVHSDLLTIHAEIDQFAAHYPDKLTRFERMVITLEDRRFFKHAAIDLKAIFRVLWRGATFRGFGGASTIDMQFVRTATGYYDRTLRRKIYEILLAKLIQYRYSKIVILRSYLNIAYFGSSMRGAEAAAFKLFDKSSAELDEDEAALIASQLVYPRPLKPSPEWERKRLRRANYIKSVYVRRKKKLDETECREFS